MHGKVLLYAPLVGGFGCDELVLYGIRVLAEQLLGTVLDIEVDHTDTKNCLLRVRVG